MVKNVKIPFFCRCRKYFLCYDKVMTVQLYNTLTKKIEPVPTHDNREVGIYACGITAYDYAHLGNLRRYVMDDVLVRVLRYDGYRVKLVQNVTDVGHLTSDADDGEDKLEKGARALGESVFATARKFEDYFYQVNERMGNLRPDVVVRASECIEQQLAIAQDLEKKGFAYFIPGEGLYFDTSKSPDYGELAGLQIDKLKEGARVDKIAGKRQPTDFAVWKLEKPGENRQMVWPSPWGERSFPGWHLECVAIGINNLGEQFEIHTGGIDHIPVHHTNEIAQAQAYSGKKPFVKTWVHHNFMLVDGKKMSKSLGNIYRLEDVEKRGFSPMALRYLFLTTHYQSEMNFTWEALAAAQKAYRHLVMDLARLSQEKPASMAEEEKINRSARFRDNFLAIIKNNLDVPQALASLSGIRKATLEDSERYDLIIELDNMLGLQLRQNVAKLLRAETEEKIVDPQAEKLLQERETARAAKNFERADQLRAQLESLGYQIRDTAIGVKLVKKDGNH